MITFGDLRTAAYCPRKLYYARRRPPDEREPPPEVERIRSLADRYEDLLAASGAALAAEPIALPPEEYRDNLAAARRDLASDRRAGTDRWRDLCDPAARDALVTGRECRGVVHKVLADPVAPALVSPGAPPERGVWEPHSVHAVAAAKALAWDRETPVESAYVEYPAHGVVRRIDLTTRRKARYRKTVRAVRSLDGPPPRIENRAKCEPCEYAEECGVRTRTLRSLLGLG